MKMKKGLAFILGFLMASMGSAAQAEQKIRVVTAHRIIADWAKQVGGDRVEVAALANGKRDLHFFEPRPSQIKLVSDADVLVLAGLQLDAWMPELIAASRNPKVQYGARGCIDPTVGIMVLEKPAGKIDFSMGDVHPYGNPHFWFLKENVLKAVDNIADGLSENYPQYKAEFEANAEAYKKKVAAKFDELTALMQPYKGTPIVTFHKSWDYFTQQFGLDVVGELEPKPGIAPSPSHLADLVNRMKTMKAQLLIAETFYPEGPIRTVQSKTGVKTLRVPQLLGERDGDSSYLDLLDKDVRDVAAALGKP